MRIIQYSLIILIFISILSLFVYGFTQDFSRRGTPCIIANTRGYVLSEDRENFLHPRREINVIYVNALGTWDIKPFPSQMVIYLIPNLPLDEPKRP